jgi:hypothetical protein
MAIAEKWYDQNNPGELHDDLRADYARTRAVAAKRPSLVRHMESCSVCQAITGATAAAPSPLSTRKRLKLAIGPEQMHALLKLPPNFEIVHMYADNDPNVVFVLVAGEGLPEVPPLVETPVARIDDVAAT